MLTTILIIVAGSFAARCITRLAIQPKLGLPWERYSGSFACPTGSGAAAGLDLAA